MNQPSVRYHAMDALRAFALLLGIVYHSAESFEPHHDNWAINDCNPSFLLSIFRHASHSFRLEMFFLMAGFFAFMVYHRRGARSFIWGRINRILIPLVVGWFLLFPIVGYVWLWGHSISGRLDLMDVPAEFQSFPPWKLIIGVIVSGEFMGNLFDLLHLWFLHQLLVIYTIVLAVRSVWVRWIDLHERKIHWIDIWFRRLIGSRWRLIIFIIPTMSFLWLMDNWTVDTPRESLIPHMPTTLLYGGFFLLGWFLYRNKDCLDSFICGWIGYLIVAFLLSPLSWALLGLMNNEWAWQNILLKRFVYQLVYSMMMWCYVIGVTGLFMRLFKKENPVWRYIADSSYWLYLIHLPLVVALQVALAPIDWPSFLKFSLILLIVFPILFITYHYLVRSTFIGAQLNGRRYPFEPLIF